MNSPATQTAMPEPPARQEAPPGPAPASRLAPGPRAGALALLALAGALALWLAAEAGVAGPGAMPELVRTGASGAAFFAVCGYGPARLLLPAALRPRLWLYVLPVGVAFGPLALTLLGLLQVPFDVSLPLVLVAGAAAAAFAVRRVPRVGAPAAAAGGRTAHLAVPLALAVLVGAVACLPALRSGFPAVQGQNGDAVLAVGTAELLQEAPPGAVRDELGLDAVPGLWRSKLPVYYGLAAVARIAGQDTVAAFTGTAALVLALGVLGFFAFVVDGFRRPALTGLAAMLLVGLDRMVLHVAYGPYFNQTWALFSLPFALLFGWLFLRAPDRASAGLAGAFGALAIFTYPLLLPFPAVFLAVVMWRRRRERGWWRALRVPAPRRAWVRYAILAVLAVPVAAVLVRGVLEKGIGAVEALAPGGDLAPWSGNGVLPFLPIGWFFGVSMPGAAGAVVLGAVFAAAGYGAWRVRGDGAVALVVVIAGGLLGALYLVARGGGELFHFKDLSFTGPLVVMLAALGLAALPWRAAAVAAVAAFAVVAADGARDNVVGVYDQTPQYLLELREWDREIPADQTIRLDVPPSGWQLWSWYLLSRHRVSAVVPLGGFFPHPPHGLKADLALVYKPQGARPLHAIGPPLRENEGFALYRLREDMPGFDVSSQSLVYD